MIVLLLIWNDPDIRSLHIGSSSSSWSRVWSSIWDRLRSLTRLASRGFLSASWRTFRASSPWSLMRSSTARGRMARTPGYYINHFSIIICNVDSFLADFYPIQSTFKLPPFYFIFIRRFFEKMFITLLLYYNSINF